MLFYSALTALTHASFLWDIHVGKQYSHRCDAALRGVTSGAILLAQRIFFKEMKYTLKNTIDARKNESGPTQKIMMEKSIRQKLVNEIPLACMCVYVDELMLTTIIVTNTRLTKSFGTKSHLLTKLYNGHRGISAS